MPYCFTKIDLIVFYRSSICKSIFSPGHILNNFSHKVYSYKQKECIHSRTILGRDHICMFVSVFPTRTVSNVCVHVEQAKKAIVSTKTKRFCTYVQLAVC